MKKIKKYARGLLATKFISIILGFGPFYAIIALKDRSSGVNVSIALIYILFYLANCILNVVFCELLSNNFSKSNFEDFETFSKCDYLKTTFNQKYKFINKVKNNCEKIFVVNLISSILEALNIF